MRTDASRILPLPPLNALRAFECAARHLSFTRAGAELFVTQTAISHQIKLLEDHLGRALFKRGARKLSLTADGVAWARELRDVFARLEDANQRLRGPATVERPVVAVSVLPSFGAGFLVPRLGEFLARHPGIDVRISATGHLVDFAVEAIDIGIRFGAGRYPGLVTEKIADDSLVVVCAPGLRTKRKLTTPADLARHVLLHDDDHEAWRRWISLHGPAGLDATKGTIFTDARLSLTAAVSGQGVALARRSLALDELRAGRLVLPFPRVKPLKTENAYFVVATRRGLKRPEVAAFRDWLREATAVLR